MGEMFALTISEGAISNVLARAREPLLVAATTIREISDGKPGFPPRSRQRPRHGVTGKTWWEWVFVGTLAVLHVIRPSRGKTVVQALFGTIQPMVWVSDMLGSQRGHAWSGMAGKCLAHLLRDARYAVECGDVTFSAAFKRLLLRAIAIGRRRDALKDTTLKQYHADLDRRLDRIMAAVPIGELGRQAGQAHRRQPQPLVRVRHQPRCALHQQRVRAKPASQRDLPQSHKRLPLRVGRRNLRRLPLRCRYRKGQPRFRPRSPSVRVGRQTIPPAARLCGVSNYKIYHVSRKGR